MSDHRTNGGQDDGITVDALFPPLGNNAHSESLMPFVELPQSVMPALSAWPFLAEPEANTQQQRDTPTVPVITETDLEAARDKAYREGFEAAEEVRARDALTRDTELEEQTEQGFSSGYEQGFAEGTEAGNAEGLQEQRAQFQDRQALLKQLTKKLDTHVSVVDELLTESVIQLVSSLTRELVQAELQLQPDTVRRVIRQALGLLPRQPTHLRIFVHPDELPGLDSLEVGNDLPLELIADPTQQKGGCLLLCDQAEVDAGLNLRLERYLESVRQELRKERSASND